MILDLLQIIVLCLVAFAFGAGLYRFRIIDTASKIFCVLVGSVLLFELAAFYAALKYHNNLRVYAVSILVQFILICLYFNYSVDVLRKKRFGLWAAVLALPFGIANIMLQTGDELHPYFIIVMGMVTIALSLFAFFRLLVEPDPPELSRYPHFWLMAIQVSYWCFTLLNWTIFNYVSTQSDTAAHYDALFILLINILTYAAVAIVFVTYPKMISKSNGR